MGEAAARAWAFTLLYEALTRWNIDQEIGSSVDLEQWINDYLDEAR